MKHKPQTAGYKLTSSASWISTSDLFGHIHRMHAKYLVFPAQLIIGELPLDWIGIIKVIISEAAVPGKASPHAHHNWVACNMQSPALAQQQQPH